jgi:hypothetical protein
MMALAVAARSTNAPDDPSARLPLPIPA